MKKVNHFQRCCGDDDVPSRDEITALNALRDIKERVRRLKKRRSEISSLGGTENRGEVEKLERVGGKKTKSSQGEDDKIGTRREMRRS